MSKNNKNRHSLPAVILAIVVVAAGAFGIIDSVHALQAETTKQVEVDIVDEIF